MSKILCILDGFGLAPMSVNNCSARAKMPNLRKIMTKYGVGSLNADGEAAGQEIGLVGNSEVGHMNIGGLKLCPQLSFQITKSAENNFKINSSLAPDQNFDPSESLKNKKVVHLAGLFSTGCIHSDLRHWAGAIRCSIDSGVEKVVLHLFSDGRDSDKKSLCQTWVNFAVQFKNTIYADKIFLGSLGGRFYAMDRDKNYDRVFSHLDLLLRTDCDDFVKENYGFNGQEIRNKIADKLELIMHKNLEIKENSDEFRNTSILNNLEFLSKKQYAEGIFDEMLLPIIYTPIENGDTLWFINFRSDRMKQLGKFIVELNTKYELELEILAMNDYGIGGGYKPVFTSKPVQNTLAETISKMGKTQLHLAETEKYAHVTFFLNGGVETKSSGEDWKVISSNKVNSHAEIPEMKAKEITDYLLENVSNYDYIITNYANPDMVGHTGDIEASIKSMEFLDTQLGKLFEKAEKDGHSMVIIADHGNVEFVGEYLKNNKELTDTEHNANPVPCIVINGQNPTSVIQRDFSQEWVTSAEVETLRKTALPLWKAGEILLNL
jgi:2,3-bisphosphoglycerate-independent phosphoglycerate mutase